MPSLLRAVSVCALLASLLPVGCTSVHEVRSSSQVLRVGIGEEPDSLNPLFSHAAAADDVAALIFAPILRYDAAGVLRPELARTVPSLENGGLSRDGRRVVLHLRPGLRWADGAPLDVGDLVYTWHAVMNPADNTKLRAGWDEITRIDTPDALTAIVHLSRPDATILGIFASGGDDAYPPLPAHLLKGLPNLNQADFNVHPLASGPWTLARWDHGSDLVFQPNPRYQLGAPKLAGIRMQVLPDADTLVNALQAHEIDYIDSVPEDRLAVIRDLEGVRLHAHDVAAYRHLDFNLRDPILADERVRRAVVDATNWDRIEQTVYHGAGLRATSDIFPASWAAPNIPPYPHDPETADELLEEAGWHRDGDGQRSKNGQPLTLTIMSSNAKATSAQAELGIAADLARIGIKLVPKNVPASYLFAQNGPLYGGHYQLAWSVDTRGPDPDNAAQWITAAQPPNGANTVFLHDPQVDVFATAARVTNDRALRRSLYAREENRLHEVLPEFIFSWQRATIAATDRLQGLRPAVYFSNFWNSWDWSLRRDARR